MSDSAATPRAQGDAPTHIWLAFHGDYEQRGPFAAFTSEELARAESDDVEQVRLFDGPPQRTVRHERWLTIRDGKVRKRERREDDWPEWVGSDWDAPVAKSDALLFCERFPDGPYIWVIVTGADKDAVEAETQRRVDEVLSGVIPPCGCAVHREGLS